MADQVFFRLALPEDETEPDTVDSDTMESVIRLSFDDYDTAITEVTGRGGQTSLTPTEIVPGQEAGAAVFDSSSIGVTLPLRFSGGDNVNLSRGGVSFWYQPNYGAGDANDTDHPVFTVGSLYNAPRLRLRTRLHAQGCVGPCASTGTLSKPAA